MRYFACFLLLISAGAKATEYPALVDNFVKIIRLEATPGFDDYCGQLQSILEKSAQLLQSTSDVGLKEKISTRLQPMVAYVERVSCREYGQAGSFADYTRVTLEKTAVGWLNGTPLLNDFVRANMHLDTLAEWNERRRGDGLSPIVFQMHFSSAVRRKISLLYVPGTTENPKVDLWIQPAEVLDSIFILAVDRSEDLVRTYARTSHLDRSRPTNYLISEKLDTISNNCFGCHASGRPLRMTKPEPGFEQVTAQLNQIIQRYPISKNDPFHPRIDFPAVGVKEGLSKEEVELFAGSVLSAEQAQNLATAASCKRCHNGRYQAQLQPPFGIALQHFIKAGVMPPSKAADVTPDQLFKLLSSEYKKRVKDYLLSE